MDVREKLVELIEKASYECDEGTRDLWDMREVADVIADFLIVNGVTVREQNGCEHCRTASYTENPFTVITQMGREVKTQFNFCPNCGRRLTQPPKGE